MSHSQGPIRVLGCLLVAALLAYASGCGSGGEPRIIASACADGEGDEVTFEIAIAALTDIDDPEYNADGSLNWTKWLSDHFEMLDADGNLVPAQKSKGAKAIPAKKQAGPEEFFVNWTLEKGEKYTVNIIPRQGGVTKYQYKFAASEKDTPFMRRRFKPTID